MHPSLHQQSHRPWPIPEGNWVWRQSWVNLLFAHWAVPVAELRGLVPPSLEVQEFDGTSWIGLVPFRMEGVMRRPFPDVPGVSAFPECNLRLYVERDGKPGVWFLSLDATNPLAVRAARLLYSLPYFRARIRMQEEGGRTHFDSVRVEEPRGADFSASYWPTSEPYEATADTLEHWLTERYCLYAEDRAGRLWRTDVHHLPWPLQSAEAEIHHNTLAQPHGLMLDEAPTLLHYSRGVDVVAWPPVTVAARS